MGKTEPPILSMDEATLIIKVQRVIWKRMDRLERLLLKHNETVGKINRRLTALYHNEKNYLTKTWPRRRKSSTKGEAK